MQMRIDKLLSQLQIATRQESKKMLKNGRVRVGETCIRDGACKVDPEKEEIYVDDERIVYQQYQYIMLHKPAGCVTATEDARHQTVMDLLPKKRHKDMAPVGRLDKDTEGLLLITDDGALAHALLAPGKHVEKTYYARISGCVDAHTVECFREGLEIGEKKPTAPAILEILSAGEASEVLVTITEGKFHQIKRMFQAVGMEVRYLKRMRMGTLQLDERLAPGECRELTAQEVENLKNGRTVC